MEFNNIPTNLEECFEALKKLFPEKDLLEFTIQPEEGTVAYHHSLGQYLRNEWGLWVGSPLQSYFKSVGIFHADDMSGIILTSFHRYLNDEPIRLEEQIKMYQDYWEKMGGMFGDSVG